MSERDVSEGKCHHGVKPEDCYRCSGAMDTLREAGVWPKGDWKAQVKQVKREREEM